MLSWDGPATPVLAWKPVRALREDEEAARRALLLDPQWFAICNECARRHVRGRMSGEICQACAHRRGVVF